MIERFGKKWLIFIFALLPLVAWAGYGYVNSDDYLASNHNAITYKQWQKISAEELAEALEKGEFNPDQLVLKSRDSIVALLEAGADPNYIIDGELTSLKTAMFTANPVAVIKTLLDGGADINLDVGDGTVLKHAKLRASNNTVHYEVYSEMYREFIRPNCPLAKADFARKQSKEEWQQSGARLCGVGGLG